MNPNNSFKIKLFERLGLIYLPHIKTYEGFGNQEHCSVMGHTLALSPKSRTKFNNSILRNTFSLLKLFMVKPLAGATVSIEWQGSTFTTKSEDDGFFIFDLPTNTPLEPKKYDVKVKLIGNDNNVVFETAAHIIVPVRGQFTFISDIDDTFLISHSASIFKRLKLLFSRNAHSRKPFDGVVNHYNALKLAHTNANEPNPFFYVSSSEWNLYDFINTFIKKNNLPAGVCLLNQLKTISGVLKTGKNNHGSKFTRIVRVLEAYPTQRFILLGDDSQRDPYIYNAITQHFPNLVYCVYIRCVGKKRNVKVENELTLIASRNIATCYFKHSSEAFAHSKEIGLIDPGD